ncbi:hypothetical protein B0H13DRAFT_1873358 [Mycena leptocephala]|nr:hypothetical protein B0H13DRAFT_1873358 [Mycena leptocephala]
MTSRIDHFFFKSGSNHRYVPACSRPPSSNDVAMNHQFIDCPNPACQERIPSRLKCRGHNTPEHKDLDYQVCTPCGYFRWLDSAAAMGAIVRAQRRLAGAPANGAPPFPPPDDPEDRWARSPPSPALEWIDPALAMPVYSLETRCEADERHRFVHADTLFEPGNLAEELEDFVHGGHRDAREPDRYSQRLCGGLVVN